MKILFFAEAVSLAHIGRPLVLARWAHENGIEVHFAASANGIKKTNAKSFGFVTHPIYTINEELFYSRVNHGKFFYQVDELKKYVFEEQALILKIKPDLKVMLCIYQAITMFLKNGRLLLGLVMPHAVLTLLPYAQKLPKNLVLLQSGLTIPKMVPQNQS